MVESVWEPEVDPGVLLREVLNRAPVAVGVLDLELRFRRVNVLLCSIVGVAAEVLLGKTPSELWPKAGPRIERGMRRALSSRVTFELETDGESLTQLENRRWHASYHPLECEGVLLGVLAIIEERTLAQALRESEARFRSAFEAAPIGVLRADLHEGREGRILDANPALERLLGYEREELMQMTVADITHPDDREGTWSTVRALSRGEMSTFRADKRYLRKDGSELWMIVSINVVFRHGAPVYTIEHLLDVSDRKRAETLLEERLSLDRQLQHTHKLESLAALAGGIAHDYNNLLTAIMGHARLLAEELEGTPAFKSVAEIDKAAHRAADLTRQMLAYSGRGQLYVESLDLGDLVATLEASAARRAPKHVRVRVERDRGALFVEIDRVQLEQLVLNLVTNAYEAIGDRPGTVTLRTGTLHADATSLATMCNADAVTLPEGQYAFLEVQDDGMGMEEATRKKAWDPFFSTKFTGRGLGLAAVQGIVRGHRGAVSIQSVPGAGTCIRCLFPLADQATSTLPPPPRQAQEHLTGTVLVIDDEALIRTLVEVLLSAEGIDVLLASDGHEGLEAFRAHHERIQLVLLDLTMPRMGGAAVLPELRRIDPRVPVVLMSGYDAQQLGREFADAGAAAFLQKPFAADTLLSVLKRHMPSAARVEVS